ncbi:MAG: antitoxin [Deltaproteobacteria bacterium RIFCSPLOWO2_01_44_7]|nr:MAG: antitoxin [Deltaproteobacteria bacterium RIFCSPHIGHO2_01_FULL_43_49]OGQ16239.1 MAG: antitoxin [Deltaproteobacteria bacterium RIFCSPHIGHO2_02_FULL_44_53]OGQ29199.1 MAG: antitoxin [Deltaproteobacteria bacterium RIFCSPHIGHO2_12_FULL_44_21]OGQ32756.1 MAG: antitoxin [Deltaproteobacteria bacterium RIFCSPLOWO2_01_FULL_45_74]OGQ41858.1 MAG: antitoxin [Deltaproteobacteria bacterium RIFCSPLOWO2_02_FULL_44_34]OGQ43439.1 MAG: antitoxin [Deltaproteobacteria bacterium RIFCSPLOWO2_01_44_7]OGQ71672.1
MAKVKRNNYWQRISIDPNVCHGQACVKGTRIPVHQIVHMLANDDSVEELLSEYPSLTKEDILTCLDYVASLAEEEVHPFETEIG